MFKPFERLTAKAPTNFSKYINLQIEEKYVILIPKRDY